MAEQKQTGYMPTDSEIRQILIERKRAERAREIQRRHERLHHTKEIADTAASFVIFAGMIFTLLYMIPAIFS